MQEGDDKTRSCGPDRMSERAGAAIDGQLLARNAEITLRRHGYDREGLVDLEQIDITDAPADFFKQLTNRGDRRGSEPSRFLAVSGVSLYLGDRRQAVPIGQGAPCQ